jgi:Na+-translocating ferredoxin:NAD+ oxidoreductase RnfE subunit
VRTYDVVVEVTTTRAGIMVVAFVVIAAVFRVVVVVVRRYAVQLWTWSNQQVPIIYTNWTCAILTMKKQPTYTW